MKTPLRLRLLTWITLTVLLAPTLRAGPVDLATSPMISGLSKVVSPNLYFILDDSGSMASEFMPDGIDSNDTKRCYKNFGYNTIYYNPNITYSAPPKADGTTYTNAPFTAALKDGFTSTSGTTNLSATTSISNTVTVTVSLGSNPFSTVRNDATVTVTHANHGLTSGTQVTFSGVTQTVGGLNFNNKTYTITVVNQNSYRFEYGTGNNNRASSTATGGGTTVKASYDTIVTSQSPTWTYSEYTANPTSPPATCQADASYAAKSPQTTAEKQNFANWYSFYRSRINLVKSAAGRTFSALDSSYRVGFSTISYTGWDTTNQDFLNIAKFNTAQKTSWYTKLYAASPSSSTPLRAALAKAGQLYAGKLITGASDPVQYACQQNFTILTTDGYWNTNDETSSYGPDQIDRSTNVGDQDGVTGTLRPYLDSSKAADTLADVAMYYYKNDLRPSYMLGGTTDEGTRVDVSANSVPGVTSDNATWQHMSTYTMGLGVSGTLAYSPNYLQGGSSDYNAIIQGTKNWPNPITNTTTARIDDLWHAAVNGHGQYFSATDPDAVVSSLTKALSSISRKVASAAAAATSSLEPIAGDNFAYIAQYTTAAWSGEVQARTIDLVTGAVSATSVWSAKATIDAAVSDSSDTRRILTYSSTSPGKLKDFTAANLTAEITANYFKPDVRNPGGALSQTTVSDWTVTQQNQATDAAMIGFLRGWTGQEAQLGNTQQLFRDRESVLGDVVNGAPVYVKKPPFRYFENNYAGFIAANSTRAGTVYVGANDGMLHALNSETGAERWAYIPSQVIPNLYKLADVAYANKHQFYVDGTVTVGDVYDGSKWITVLVGGLGGGGKGYYALDITNPDNPIALWEFGPAQDADIGYSYGNPIITKRGLDGTWTVLFASGYNNVSPGDSKGRLYVLNALTGTLISEIQTTQTNNPDLSGIAKIANLVPETLTDNTTQFVYGGDLRGAIWRFDIASDTVQKLGTTSATAGNQPITVRPELAQIRDTVGNVHTVVYLATGRYLGFSDIAANAPATLAAQAVYALKDSGADVGILTTVQANLVAQTLNATANPRTIPNPVAVDWGASNGWFLTLPVGERINVDPKLQLGTLVLVSNIPRDDYCVVGGSSVLYALDYKTGGAITSQLTKSVGFPIGNSLSTGLTLVRLPTGKLVAIVTEADTTLQVTSVPTSPTGASTLRRVIWREIR